VNDIIILCFFTMVAQGVNLYYELDRSVVHKTDGLCWLWTQLWLCPKQRTAALLPQRVQHERLRIHNLSCMLCPILKKVLITRLVSL